MNDRVEVHLSAPPFPCPVVLVTAASKGRDSIITLAWVGMLCSTPMTIGVGIRPERFTFGLIKESGEFVVNVPDAGMLAKVDACGVRSGRDIDKFSEFNLTRVPGKVVSAPVIAECPVALECKLKQTIDLGTHHLFLGEMVSASARADVLAAAGHLHMEKLDPFVYLGGKYRAVGTDIGAYGAEARRTGKAQR